MVERFLRLINQRGRIGTSEQGSLDRWLSTTAFPDSYCLQQWPALLSPTLSYREAVQWAVQSPGAGHLLCGSGVRPSRQTARTVTTILPTNPLHPACRKQGKLSLPSRLSPAWWAADSAFQWSLKACGSSDQSECKPHNFQQQACSGSVSSACCPKCIFAAQVCKLKATRCFQMTVISWWSLRKLTLLCL